MRETERIVKLEELGAHNARTIEELHAEVARLTERQFAVEKTLMTLVKRVVAVEEGSHSPPDQTKPPHW